MNSSENPVGFNGNRSEINGKNPKCFLLEYCFRISVISEAFLPDPAVQLCLGQLTIEGGGERKRGDFSLLNF